jgi:hypothetical protein
MPPQIKRTDAGTGAIIDQDFLGEEIDTNFLGDEIPRDQWRQDDNGNIIIDPAPVEENFLGPELTASGDLKYEDGVFTFEGFKEWEAKEREEGRDGFWHWLTVTLPEGSKDAFSYLYEGGKELPEKFKEDPLKATAIFPEAALSAAEGYKDIATGAIDLVQRPFRSEQENERARYERYKLFADRSKRILEDRKSRVGDAIRAAGYLLDSDLEDYASAYDEGINPASADTLSIIFDPAALFGGSLYRTAGRVVGKPAVAANKALNNAIKGVNQGTFKKVLDVAKETAKRPATQFTKGVGKTVDLTGKGIEFVGQKIVDAGQQGRMLQSFPQLAKGVGEAVKLKGGAIGTPGQILSVASEAAQKAGRRQTGLGLVKKKGTLRAPIQKAVQILDTPLSDRLLRNAGDLADKITKGTAIGIGTGYVAGGAEGAAAGGGFGAFGGGVGFGAEKAAKYTPLVRNKFKGMERLKLDEEFITDYAARLPEAERKGFLNPDRRMSVSDLAAEADAAQLFQGYLRKEGANVGIKYVDGEGMVKALSRDPENPNVNARYQYGAYDKNSNTIFINTDSSGTGRNRTLFHELFHPTEYFSAPREKTRGRDKGEQVDPFGETRAELEQTLFGTFDGAGNQITKGMYNKKQMLDFENQYLDAVFQQNPTSPLGRKIAEARKLRDQAIKDNDTEAIDKITFLLGQYELQKRQNRKAKENYLKGDVATRRKNITSEILSEHFANFGEEAHFGLLRKAKDVLQRDRFSKNTLSNKLAKLSLSTLGGMRRMLEGKGVTFDAAGNPKGDFKAESGIFVDPLTGENLITTPEVEHLLAQYVVSLDKFNNRLIIDKTGFDTVETASSLKDTKRSELTPEREKQLREIGWLEDFDAEDNPIFSTARKRNKQHREEVAKVIDILNANPDDTGEPKMWRKTKTKAGRDRWEAGVPSEKQMQALRNSDLDPSYVEKIDKIRNAILKGDGTIWGNDYYKAITGGKYDSRAKVKFSLIVPFALEATQAGNINIKAFNLSKLEQKIGNYADQRPAFFDAWNGDTDAFRRDIVDFFQGPNRGKLFPEGDRKDLIYQFLGIKNKQNPLSGEWVDNSRLIESNRIERSTNLNPYENLDKIPFDYGKALRREYMPEPNQQQGARFMPAPADRNLSSFVEEVQRMRKIGRARPSEGFDSSFHINTKLMELFSDLGSKKNIRAEKGQPVLFDIELSDKAKGSESFIREQVANFVASLPSKKSVDLRSNESVDPYAIAKKYFPDGEVKDISETLRNISNFAAYAAPDSDYGKASLNRTVDNLVDLAEGNGATVNNEVKDLISERAYGKAKQTIERETFEAIRQGQDPEFKDITDLGGATLSTDIRFMPAPAEGAFNKAKETFGTTQDLLEAGYILPDGEMLDFSGRHEGADERDIAGQRYSDHREISQAGVEMQPFIDSGAVRIDARNGLIETGQEPTGSQYSQIRKIIEDKDSEVYIDLKDPNRDDAAEMFTVIQPEVGTDPKRVIGLIKRFYRGDDISSAVRFMPQPTFYSKAERAVEGAKAGIFNKEGMTSVGQAKALLEKNAPETELEWSGVLDYLDLQKEQSEKQAQTYKELIEISEKNIASGKTEDPFTGKVRNLNPVELEATKRTLEDYKRKLRFSQDKISKQDLLSYLKNNGVEVEEVYRGGADPKDFDASVAFINMPPALAPYNTGKPIPKKMRDSFNAKAKDTDGNVEEFSIVREKDGEDYTYYVVGEDNKRVNIEEEASAGKQDLKDVEAAIIKFMEDKYKPERPTIPEGAVGPTLFSPTEQFAGGPASLPGGENYSELVLKLPERSPEDTYNVPSGHRFPEQNILAHIRFTERTDADGKRMLFLDEVQSDWSTDIRKKGVKKERPESIQRERDELEAEGYKIMESDAYRNIGYLERKETLAEQLETVENIKLGWPDYPAYQDKKNNLTSKIAEVDKKIRETENKKYSDLYDTPEKLKQRFRDVKKRMHQIDTDFPKYPKGEPDMPYKGSKWQDLVMKRMIRWAADNGYDRLGWITGKDTADRYDLSKAVDEIKYIPEQQRLIASRGEYGKQSYERVVDKEQVTPENLESYIGKDLAKKLIESPEKGEGEPGYGIVKTRVLSGKDLQISPAWAENLYDKSLPKIARKLTKKKGAVGRVGIYGSSSKLNGALAKNGIKPKYEANYVDISPEVKELAQEGFSYFMPEGRGGAASAPVQAAAPQPPSGVIIPKVKLTEDEKEESRKLLQQLLD